MRSRAQISLRRRREATYRRRLRLLDARRKGTHTADEWAALLSQCGERCVRCGSNPGPLSIVKDHIVPICDGGSDAIANLQPLCWTCNSSKRHEAIDHRPLAARAALGLP